MIGVRMCGAWRFYGRLMNTNDYRAFLDKSVSSPKTPGGYKTGMIASLPWALKACHLTVPYDYTVSKGINKCSWGVGFPISFISILLFL